MNATAIARSIVGAVAVALASAATGYPDKPVQYIIPFAGGSESDIAARLQAQAFSTKYKMEDTRLVEALGNVLARSDR